MLMRDGGHIPIIILILGSGRSMFEISEKNEKRITLLLCVVFFGIFLYIEFNFFQYLELRLLMFMLMILTFYGYIRLQSIYNSPGRRLKLLFYTIFLALFFYIVVLTQQPLSLRTIMTVVAIAALILLTFDQQRRK
jgi:4-amino-4-deoxy-L-arabinose transferase-like glycosyltransferase